MNRQTKAGWSTGVLSVLCAFLLLAATMHRPDELDDSRAVARVNGHPITVARFNHSYVHYLIRTGRNDTPENRYAHLNNLIDGFVLAAEARVRGLDREDEYLAYADRHRKLALGGRYFEVAFADSLPPLTDAEIRDAFRQSKEMVALRHLFFYDPAAAQAAYARLEAGADFVQLANEVFQTASFDSSAGFLGFTSYKALDDAVAEAAAALPAGQYSEPVRSSYGWHILRVEERLFNPLLTESEYQYRRQGIAAHARIRRNRLEGDRFVRAMMEGLNVQVDEDGARMVVEALANVLDDPPAAAPPVALTENEVQAVRAALTPETVLVTYTLDGQPRTFTALDYYRWLPELPYDEVRNRPVASVGRALRNEVLALKGQAMDLEDDPRVQETLSFVTAMFLAGRMREYVRTHHPVEPTDAEVAEAFERLGFRKLREARADYWQIPFASLSEAREAKRDIEAGDAPPAAFEGFAHYEDQDLREAALGGHIRTAPLDAPVVVCIDPMCYVLHVSDRTLRYTTIEEREEEIRDLLRRTLPEIKLLDSLYRYADIQVDTLLFNQMMNLHRPSTTTIGDEEKDETGK